MQVAEAAVGIIILVINIGLLAFFVGVLLRHSWENARVGPGPRCRPKGGLTG